MVQPPPPPPPSRSTNADPSNDSPKSQEPSTGVLKLPTSKFDTAPIGTVVNSDYLSLILL
ncbi:hypothetical protein H9L39_11071 [Fusarium oxysporum f. sp. albedinis]|nr:hypothetical protein H9L39_11071 [Fusarium oxysporum f. sp. albedinis]